MIKRFLNVYPRIFPGNCVKYVSYVQGQEPEPKIREYFYYIDHQGMLFLDDSKMKNFTSCLKDKKFLQFFFNRIRRNNTNRYTDDFPYISLCGRERNFIRCDDVPIVYTHVLRRKNKKDVEENVLSYGHAGDLLITPFMPDKIFMFPDTGRVYHPAGEKFGSVGLIRSKLSIEFSKYFDFENGQNSPPTHFTWDGTRYELDQNWLQNVITEHKVKIKGSE